jgi:peroxiredoxin
MLGLIKKGHVRALTAALGAILVLGAAMPGFGRDDVPELPSPDGSGDTPEIIVPMIDKTTTKLSSLRGRVVLLDFFWSQCAHCRDHAPHIVELYNELSKRGLVILGLATDTQDKSADVKAFMRDLKINYPVGFITNELVAYYTDSHNHGVPQMVLFGPDGKMARRLIGWDEKNGKDLRDAILAQLQKLPTVKPGSKASSRPVRRATHA